FLILFSNALPMSLYVTVEMVNFGQAFFIDNDKELFDEESNTPARAVTSNLNSDLGQVEFIFSDKTGTLTQNVMIFRRCSVGGKIFGEPLMEADPNTNNNHSNIVNQTTSNNSDSLAHKALNGVNGVLTLDSQTHHEDYSNDTDQYSEVRN